MRKKFEGAILNEIPNDIKINKWLNSDRLRVLSQSRDAGFSVVTHPDYICTEYKMKLNLFVFRRFRFYLPVNIIGPPVSVDSIGYGGHLDTLIADYKRRKGLYLILNLPEYPVLNEKSTIGETLPACLFHNRFSSFEEYISTLRGSYRRRIKHAFEKGTCLRVEKISNAEYSEKLHSLYEQVRSKSKYPLETLNAGFFRRFEGDIYVFYDADEPVAFVALTQSDREMDFVFGGMDYLKRDKFDLHYNMLLLILRLAIQQKARWVNFGQTAENSKQRIGCVLSKRYMVAFSGNPIVNWVLRVFGKMIVYQSPKKVYRCFKGNPGNDS